MYANVWWFICVMCSLWSMWIAQHALDRGMLLTDRNLYGCQSFSCMHFVIVSETLFGVLQIHRQFEVSSMFNSSFFLSQRSSQRDFDLWIQNVDANFEISLWVDFVDLIYLQPRNYRESQLMKLSCFQHFGNRRVVLIKHSCNARFHAN